MARVVVPNYPHHVVQRGNRRQQTFFCESDYMVYLSLVAGAKREAGADIWAYCLMPNHVHLVTVPADKNGLARLFGESHRRYTRRINRREGWQGHLWQERFHSFVLDEDHLRATVRYTELNPVRAGLCSDPARWPWSSAAAHLRGEDDELVTVAPMLQRIGDWQQYLEVVDAVEKLDRIRSHTRTGRPAGDNSFVEELERITGRSLKRQKPGPKSGDSLLN